MMFKMIRADKVPRKDLNQSLINPELKSLCTTTLFPDRFHFNLVLLLTNLSPTGMALAESEEPDLDQLVRSRNLQS